jgi:hypothetical protein
MQLWVITNRVGKGDVAGATFLESPPSPAASSTKSVGKVPPKEKEAAAAAAAAGGKEKEPPAGKKEAAGKGKEAPPKGKEPSNKDTSQQQQQPAAAAAAAKEEEAKELPISNTQTIRDILLKEKGDVELWRSVLPSGTVIRYKENGGAQVLTTTTTMQNREGDLLQANTHTHTHTHTQTQTQTPHKTQQSITPYYCYVHLSSSCALIFVL